MAYIQVQFTHHGLLDTSLCSIGWEDQDEASGRFGVRKPGLMLAYIPIPSQRVDMRLPSICHCEVSRLLPFAFAARFMGGAGEWRLWLHASSVQQGGTQEFGEVDGWLGILFARGGTSVMHADNDV